MFFNDYIKVLTESITQNSVESQVTSKLKHLQQKIINIHRQIQIGNYQEVYPAKNHELNKLKSHALDEYKNYVNANMDTIVRYPMVNRMYQDFNEVLKSLKHTKA